MSGLQNFSYILPRPVRDVVMAVPRMKGTFSAFTSKGDGLDEVRGALASTGIPAIGVRAQAKQMIVGALRLALLAAGLFTVSRMGWQKAPAIAIGAVVSLPTVAMAFGGKMLFNGMTLVKSSLTSGALESLAKGFALLAAGFITLEWHDVVSPFGLLDNAIDSTAEKYAPDVVKFFAPSTGRD